MVHLAPRFSLTCNERPLVRLVVSPPVDLLFARQLCEFSSFRMIYHRDPRQGSVGASAEVQLQHHHAHVRGHAQLCSVGQSCVLNAAFGVNFHDL